MSLFLDPESAARVKGIDVNNTSNYFDLGVCSGITTAIINGFTSTSVAFGSCPRGHILDVAEQLKAKGFTITYTNFEGSDFIGIAWTNA